MQLRKIEKQIIGRNILEGAGVKLVRVIGDQDIEEFDPFLLLDAFDSHNPSDYVKGFPWHPHRGIETITYLVRGQVEHGDSLGNRGEILDGDCQWMTSGSGIIHQEMPQPSPHLLGVQLWLNLPAKDKLTKPKYQDILQQSIPVVEENSCTVHILAGRYEDTVGAFSGEYVTPLILDVEVKPHAEWSIPTELTDTLFVYILQGDAVFHPDDDQSTKAKQAVLFGPGDSLWVKASGNGIRFLLFAAKPLQEPIAWGGPIVMNTKQELDQAFRDLDNNTFIK